MYGLLVVTHPGTLLSGGAQAGAYPAGLIRTPSEGFCLALTPERRTPPYGSALRPPALSRRWRSDTLLVSPAGLPKMDHLTLPSGTLGGEHHQVALQRLLRAAQDEGGIAL